MPAGMKQPLKGPVGSQFCDSCQIFFQITQPAKFALSSTPSNFVQCAVSPQDLPKCLDFYGDSQRKPTKLSQREKLIAFNNLSFLGPM